MSRYDLVATADRILGPRLLELGFRVTDIGETHATYSGGHRAISLSYYREDLPHPWLSVTVGLSDAPGETPHLVALWRAYPEAGDLQDPSTMGFDSQQSLEARLTRIRDEWLPSYVVPLFADEALLRLALVDQEREVLEEHGRLALSQQLRRARMMFDDGDYGGAMDAYTLCGVDELSAADRRRMILARKFAAGEGAP